LIFKPRKLKNFPCQTLTFSSKIVIKINIFMHLLSLGKEQHWTMRSVERIFFVHTSSVYFCHFIYWLLKCEKIFISYAFILLCL
jgi:hypothetical protein